MNGKRTRVLEKRCFLGALKELVVFVAAGLVSSNGFAASIGLFSDQNCSSCNLTIPSSETRTLYIKVEAGTLEWAGAEFRVSGLPVGWAATSTPNPVMTFVLGDPFGSGVNVGFPAAQTGDCILLYTVQVTAMSALNDVLLRVEAKDPPTNPQWNYPFLVRANSPIHTPVQAEAGSLFINSALECTVAVQPSSWSQVKRFYD